MDFNNSRQPDGSYSFLDFTLDLATERLIGGTGEIKLRPKSFQVMRYLVEHHGRLVAREELMQAVWGGVAVTDESITKCIGDIRKALGDDAQEIIRTVTRKGFLLQVEVRFVPPPQAAHQPASLSQTAPAPANPDRRGVFTHRWSLLLMSTVVVALAAGLLWFVFGHRSLPAYEAIAVLPFESLSPGEDQQFLADGMTEALITNLGQTSPLRVIARTSVNRYQKTKKPVQEIARELNVDVLVEGTVMQSGDRLRVTANLIQVSPEKHIWAHSYERDLRDALTLQNEIAGAISDAIPGNLTTRPRSRLPKTRPVNPKAQIALWKTRYFVHSRRNREGALKSIEYAEEAVRLAPDWPPAHAGLAQAYVMLSFVGRVAPSEAMPRAMAAAKQAIALDDQLAEAHAALAWALLGYDWDWAGAEREARRAISLNPSDADAREVLANYLSAVGRVEEAVAEIKRARELDPQSFLINRNVGRLLYFARRYDEALAELRQAGDMQPNVSVVDLWIVKCYLQKGQAAEAVAADLRVRGSRDGLDGPALGALRAAFAQKGLPGYWKKLRELVLPRFSTIIGGAYQLTEINTELGDHEEAFRYLEKAYEVRYGTMAWIKVDPSLDPLRPDPRFSALLRRMGLTP